MRLVAVIGARGIVAVCVCASALAWAAGPARADGTDPAYPGSVLHVNASGPLTAGSILTIHATGTNAAMDFGGASYGLDLYLVNAGALPGPCATNSSGEQAVWADNVKYVSFLTPQPLQEGNGVPFNISTPVTLNNITGRLLVCAYTEFGFIDDAAWASAAVTVAAGPALASSRFSSRRVTVGATSGCWPLATTARETAQGLKGVRHPARPLVFSFQQAGSYSFTMTGVPAPVNAVWIGTANDVIGRWHGTPDSSAPHVPPARVRAVVAYPVGWRLPADGARLRVGGRCSSSAGL